MRKGLRRGFTAHELILVVGGLVSVGMMIALLVVVVHFIAKFW